MSLFDQIKADYLQSQEKRDTHRMSAFKVILGEFARLPNTKTPSDEQVIKILRTLEKNEKLILENKNQQSSVYLQVVQAYIPVMMSRQEITRFIYDNIKVREYKKLMDAMPDIMSKLQGKADGNTVRANLLEIGQEIEKTHKNNWMDTERENK